jgi:glucose-6-phosphate isomerase
MSTGYVPQMQAWADLAKHSRRLHRIHTRDLFDRDRERFTGFSREREALVVDFSRQRIDRKAFEKLLALADVARLRERIDAMWRGDPINDTEHRAVLHVALRQPPGAGIGGAVIERTVLEERARMLAFAAGVREGRILGSSGQRFRLVVNIGIGGSDLGPAMAVLALHNYRDGGPRCVYVSNVDGCQLADLLADADPATTLFIVASKTFSTQETLANAHSARRWILEKLGRERLPQHFAAVSVNQRAMDEFGIHPEYRFVMWDWVGGRYSIWSSIGVSLAIAIGERHFQQFLAGGHAIDEHFRTAPWAQNLPVLLALLGVWNINFFALPTHAVLPYDERLKRLPAYLQQLEMESNGKSVSRDNTPIRWSTAPVIWGEPGNNAQHSFFQMLHQGTPRAALDFLLPVRSSCGDETAQALAIANCLAQAEAFMAGQPSDLPQKVHAGDRPSTLIIFETLDPVTLGKLVALYEHKVFVQSVIWGINAFDQWGVELGKKLCEGLVPIVRDRVAVDNLPRAVKDLLPAIRKWQGT